MRGQHHHTFEDCSLRAEDLGRREHVEKVLLGTFRGAVVEGEEIVWTQPTFELRFKPEAGPRPRRIDVHVSLCGIDLEEVIAALSTKARGQLQERRLWRFFDVTTGQAIPWTPAKRRSLSKNGLVTIDLSAEAFISQSQSGPGTHLLVSLISALDVDAFMERAPLQPNDDVTFGWQNIEAVTPLGTHLFAFHFGGQGRELASERVRRFASESGLSVGTVAHDKIVVSGPLPEIVQASACKAFLHDVWEDSLKRGGCLWRQAFLVYRPDSTEVTRQVATVTVQPCNELNDGTAG